MPQVELSRRTFFKTVAAIGAFSAITHLEPQPVYGAFISGGQNTPVQEEVPTPEVPKLSKFFFGLSMSSNKITPQTLDQLGAGSVLNWRTDATPAIAQAIRAVRLKYLPMLRTGRYHWKRLGFMGENGAVDHTAIANTVRNTIRDFGPGLSWIIGNEPNIATDDPDSDAIAPEEFAVQFDALVGAIKKEDSTAIIVGPSIAGWLQKPEGKKWYEEFYRVYLDTHNGKLPPIDSHNIHLYDVTNWQMTWDKRIAHGGSNTQLLIQELESFREWINRFGPQNPIIITEFGMMHCSNSWGAYMDCLPQDNTQLEQTAVSVLTELTMYFAKHQNRLKIAAIFPFFDGLSGHNQNIYPLRLFKKSDTEIQLTQTGEVYRRLIQMHTV